MIKYTIKRLLIAIPVFLGITFIVFFLVNIAPGGPLDIMASSGELSQSDLEALRVSWGWISRSLSGILSGLGNCSRGIWAPPTALRRRSA